MSRDPTSTSSPEPEGAGARARMTREQRRRQLIETALDLFAERGFAETTTKEIATAAGVSEGVIYHHFPTKDDLYTAILEQKWREADSDEWHQELRRHAERSDDEAFFRTIVSKVLDSYESDPRYRRMMLDASLRGHEIASLALRKLHMPTFGFLQDYVRRRQAEGALRELDPGLVVVALVAMPIYYSMVTHLFGALPPHGDEDEPLATFTTLFIEGLRRR